MMYIPFFRVQVFLIQPLNINIVSFIYYFSTVYPKSKKKTEPIDSTLKLCANVYPSLFGRDVINLVASLRDLYIRIMFRYAPCYECDI